MTSLTVSVTLGELENIQPYPHLVVLVRLGNKVKRTSVSSTNNCQPSWTDQIKITRHHEDSLEIRLAAIETPHSSQSLLVGIATIPYSLIQDSPLI